MDAFSIHSVIASIKERHALKSNYAVSEFLGISHQSLGNWLKGRTFPDERMTGILAAAAGLDRDVLTAYYQAQRSTGEAREVWLRISRRLAGKDGAAEKFAAAFAITSVAPPAESAGLAWPLFPEWEEGK